MIREFFLSVNSYVSYKLYGDTFDNSREKVYVIGNGWASYFFVKNLNKRMYEPIIIAPNTKVLNTPRLTELITDPNAKVEFSNPYAKIIQDKLEDIDIKNKILITETGKTFAYTNVILAIGSEPNDFGIEGVDEYTHKFKTIEDANNLRNLINTKFSTDTLVYIVGSGITGIELATKFHSISVPVKLIEGLDNILLGYNDETKSNIVSKISEKYKKVKLILNTKVTKISERFIHCNDPTHPNGQYKFLSGEYVWNQNKSKKFIEYMTIWTGGVRFCGYGKTNLFKTLNNITLIKSRGLDVQKNFSIGEKNLGIYCIGDMVANMGPSSAQNAKNQGIWLAKYFNNDMRVEKIDPYEIKSKGKLVHLESDLYLETKYYSGFVPNFFGIIFDLLSK